jgi:predicted DNA-binding transcriptional regulator AlpA
MGIRTVTTQQVEDQYAISKTTQWRMRRAGLMPPLLELSPGRKAYTEAQLDTWLAEKQRLAEERQRAGLQDQTRGPGRPRKGDQRQLEPINE